MVLWGRKRSSAWGRLSVGRTLLVFLIFTGSLLSAERIRVVTWNIENYLTMNRVIESGWRPDYPKRESAKAALRRVVGALEADVLALQEVGSEPFLFELQRDLQMEGLDYPYAFLMKGADEVRHTAVLSKLKPVEAGHHAGLTFPYQGRRVPLKRGLLEVCFETEGVRWVLFNLHLKSNFTNYPEDPQSADRRTGEARVARDFIRNQFEGDSVPYLIAGDLNDTTRSAPVRHFLRAGDQTLAHMLDARDGEGRRWTHRWRAQDVYSRFDYLMASPAMLPYVSEAGAWIADGEDVLEASDHRPVVVDLEFPFEGGGLEAETTQ